MNFQKYKDSRNNKIYEVHFAKDGGISIKGDQFFFIDKWISWKEISKEEFEKNFEILPQMQQLDYLVGNKIRRV